MGEAKKARVQTDSLTVTYNKLRDEIVGGALAPGSALIERRVAELIKVSRATVRSALQRLQQDGFVTASQIGDRYSRFFVAPITISDMWEWYMMFGALDGIGARLAAGLPEKKRQSIGSVGRSANEELKRLGKEKDPRFEKICTLDARLHGAYVTAAAGPRLLSAYDSIRPQVERYARLYATALVREIPTAVFDEHLAIVEAIEKGRADAAERAAVKNWRNAAKRFEVQMRSVGELGTWQLGGSGA